MQRFSIDMVGCEKRRRLPLPQCKHLSLKPQPCATDDKPFVALECRRLDDLTTLRRNMDDFSEIERKAILLSAVPPNKILSVLIGDPGNPLEWTTADWWYFFQATFARIKVVRSDVKDGTYILYCWNWKQDCKAPWMDQSGSKAISARRGRTKRGYAQYCDLC